jgi:hypothetical protein
MSGVLRWEEPPPTKAGQHLRKQGTRFGDEWREIAEELRANPGRWGVIAEGERPLEALVSHIRHARFPVWGPAGSFDATCRKRFDEYTLYACYVGAGSSTENGEPR